MSRNYQPPNPPPLPRGDRNMNPPSIGLLALLREDLANHDGDWFDQGFWAVAVHRLGNWRMSIRPKLLRCPFTVLYRVLYKCVEWTCGISLPYTVPVGRRVRIWHHSGIILHARAIGDDVHLRHNTTMGVARRGRNLELPTIGDRVDIGVGACILGNVAVGHDSVIGANAVVLTDVPPWSLCVGVPARIMPRKDAPVDSIDGAESPPPREVRAATVRVPMEAGR